MSARTFGSSSSWASITFSRRALRSSKTEKQNGASRLRAGYTERHAKKLHLTGKQAAARVVCEQLEQATANSGGDFEPHLSYTLATACAPLCCTDLPWRETNCDQVQLQQGKVKTSDVEKNALEKRATAKASFLPPASVAIQKFADVWTCRGPSSARRSSSPQPEINCSARSFVSSSSRTHTNMPPEGMDADASTVSP